MIVLNPQLAEHINNIGDEDKSHDKNHLEKTLECDNTASNPIFDEKEYFADHHSETADSTADIREQEHHDGRSRLVKIVTGPLHLLFDRSHNDSEDKQKGAGKLGGHAALLHNPLAMISFGVLMGYMIGRNKPPEHNFFSSYEECSNMSESFEYVCFKDSWRWLFGHCFFLLLPLGFVIIILLMTSHIRHLSRNIKHGEKDLVSPLGDDSKTDSPAQLEADCNPWDAMAEKILEGRQRTNAALGLAHAPPLSSNFQNYPTTTTKLEFDADIESDTKQIIVQCVELAELHSNLLSSHDYALEMTRIGSSLHLGLGPNSTCVARVENATVGRENRKRRRERDKNTTGAQNRSSQRGAKSPLGLQNARFLLYRLMLEQAASLESVSCSLRDCEWRQDELLRGDSCFESLEETDNDSLDWITYDGSHSEKRNALLSSPLPLLDPQSVSLTLSFLKSSRRQLGEFLSEVLSEVFSFVSCKEGTTFSYLQELNDRIKDSMRVAEENIAYLTTAFPFANLSDENRRDMEGNLSQNVKGENRSSVKELKATAADVHRQKKQFVEAIRARIDAAYVSLWAFQQKVFPWTGNENCCAVLASERRTTEDGPGTDESVCATCSSAEGKDNDADFICGWDRDNVKWWVILRDMLREAVAIHSDFEENFLKLHSKEPAVDCVDDDGSVTELIKEGYGPLQYEDNGHSDIRNGCKNEDPMWMGKTVVFSGKGILSKKTEGNRSRVNLDDSKKPLPPISSLESPVGRLSLLRELRSRIESMDLADEWDVNVKEYREGIGICDDTKLYDRCGVQADKQAFHSTSVPFFLGASGSLLSELKQAIVPGEVMVGNGDDTMEDATWMERG